MSDPEHDVVDIWVNLVTDDVVTEFLGKEANAGIPGYLGSTLEGGGGVEQLLERMDTSGVATGVLTCGLSRRSGAQALEVADAQPGRFLVAATVTDDRPGSNVARIRELAQHPGFVMVRVTPLFTQVPIDDPKHYPIYQVCEELGLPVGINVGVPGPKVRSRVQHPELLEDVLIDFPDLVVIGAHMGHPYEELFMNFMRKWETLYLSCTAYAPKYLDPGLVKFMSTSAYRGRVLWGSDDPWFPMVRSLQEAQALPLDHGAMGLFLGGTARRLFARTT